MDGELVRMANASCATWRGIYMGQSLWYAPLQDVHLQEQSRDFCPLLLSVSGSVGQHGDPSIFAMHIEQERDPNHLLYSTPPFDSDSVDRSHCQCFQALHSPFTSPLTRANISLGP